MKALLASNLGRLRLVGILEGISLLLLLGIAVPAKHWLGYPALVQFLGLIHGTLFLLFVLLTLQVGVEQRWTFRHTTWKVLVACLVPFGTFYIDQKILRKR